MRILIEDDFCPPLILRVIAERKDKYLALDDDNIVHIVKKNECTVIYDENKQWWFFFFIGLLVTLAIFSLYMLIQ